ncbi:unnamed protein product [Fraxinus pennsylvanica]|uniref:Uncharacterized protein n=1 Tax=Fraxinus pennsylvanica TaxID=56036 RepID=A0AAD2DU11_9LAMI|nr:unnamed protein product [Fraxinus pennsylvanica]
MDGGDSSEKGTVTCATWIRQLKNAHLVVLGKSSPSSLEIFSFDPKTTSLPPSPKVKFEFEEGVNPVTIAVHPSGDDVVVKRSGFTVDSSFADSQTAVGSKQSVRDRLGSNVDLSLQVNKRTYSSGMWPAGYSFEERCDKDMQNEQWQLGNKSTPI